MNKEQTSLSNQNKALTIVSKQAVLTIANIKLAARYRVKIIWLEIQKKKMIIKIFWDLFQWKLHKN